MLLYLVFLICCNFGWSEIFQLQTFENIPKYKNIAMCLVSERMASSEMSPGLLAEPWFLATIIGTIGGIIWVAFCIFSVLLFRKRKVSKMRKTNGDEAGYVAELLCLIIECTLCCWWEIVCCVCGVGLGRAFDAFSAGG